MLRNQKRDKRAEKSLGFVILVVLAVIITNVFYVLFYYDSVSPLAHSMQSSASGQVAASKTEAANPMISLPKGIVSLTPPEVFDPQNLYDKIDGAADLYLSSGFLGLQCQSFTEVGHPDTWIEVFIYDMGNTMNAFAVFSSHRRSEARALDIGQFSYATKEALFFVHGPYYVEIIASTAGEKTLEAMQDMASNFINENKVDVKSIPELALFPRRNLDENSISLIISDAFGFDRFDVVFTAVYRLRDKKMTAFLSQRKTPEEATRFAQAYYEFLLAYDGKGQEPEVPIEGAKMVEIMDTYELVFACGPFLAGVREASSAEQAATLANMLDQKLREAAVEG